MRWLKRILLVLLVIIVAVVILVFAFISPIAKYLIQRNSVEWTGRKIEIGSLFINIFSGGVSAGNLKIYEADQRNQFLYCRKLQTGISIPKLINSKYDITKFSLDSPVITIIQTGDHFNYDDLIKRFSSTDTTSKTSTEPTAWWLRSPQIKNGTIRYVNSSPKSEITLLKTNISSPGFAYDSALYKFKIDCGLASGGSLSTNMKMNIETMRYFSTINLDKVSISFLLPYLSDYLYVKSLDGLLSSSLNLTGNLKKSEEIAAHGNVSLDNFSLVDTTGEKLAAIENVNVNMDSLNTAAGVYDFKEITVLRPFVKFAMYEDGYNIDRIVTSYGEDSSTTPEGVAPEEYSNVFKMMANYIKSIAESYLVQKYAADRLLISGGHVIYTDYTLEDKFQYDLDSLTISSDNVSSAKDSIHFALQSQLNRSGKLNGYVNISTANLNNMRIYYDISDLRMADVNPYSKFYVATPFLNGNIFYADRTTIHDSKLKSSNNIRIEQIKVGDKTGNPVYNVPVKLAVSLLTDLHGNIDLDIPVEGDLSDPKYRWGKVIWQTLENILLKAATSPYRLLANAFGGNEDDYKSIYFDYLQHSLTDKQEKPLNGISGVLKNKPDMKAELVQMVNRQEEIENAALFQLKKEYLGYKSSDSVTEEMASKIEAVANKDSLFNKFVNKKLGTNEALTSVQDKCIKICGRENLEAAETQLIDGRNKSVYDHLLQQQIPAEQVMVHTASGDSSIAAAVPQFVINYGLKEPQVSDSSSANRSQHK